MEGGRGFFSLNVIPLTSLPADWRYGYSFLSSLRSQLVIGSPVSHQQRVSTSHISSRPRFLRIPPSKQWVWVEGTVSSEWKSWMDEEGVPRLFDRKLYQAMEAGSRRWGHSCQAYSAASRALAVFVCCSWRLHGLMREVSISQDCVLGLVQVWLKLRLGARMITCTFLWIIAHRWFFSIYQVLILSHSRCKISWEGGVNGAVSYSSW